MIFAEPILRTARVLLCARHPKDVFRHSCWHSSIILSNCEVPTNCLMLCALTQDTGRLTTIRVKIYEKGGWRGVKSVFFLRSWRWVLLRLGEVLSDNLPGLRGDPVGKTDRKLHNEVTSLWRVLGERKAFPSESLYRPWLDDVMTGKRDDAVFQCGNANSATTQCLERRGRVE